jgi:hypothetical protein
MSMNSTPYNQMLAQGLQQAGAPMTTSGAVANAMNAYGQQMAQQGAGGAVNPGGTAAGAYLNAQRNRFLGGLFGLGQAAQGGAPGGQG